MKGLQAAATVLQMLFKDSPADLRFTRVKLLLAIRTFLSKVAWQINKNKSIMKSTKITKNVNCSTIMIFAKIDFRD